MVTWPRLLLVLGVLARTAWLSLPIPGVFSFLDVDPDPRLDLALGQQILDGPLHLVTLAKTSPGARQPLAQLRQRRQGPLHATSPCGEVQFGLPRAAVPQQPIAFGTEPLIGADEQVIGDVPLLVRDIVQGLPTNASGD